MRRRLPVPAALLLLLTCSSTINAFIPAGCTLSFTGKRPQKLAFTTLSKSPPSKQRTALQASLTPQQLGIEEAKKCLSEIEAAVESAREYLAYMGEVAQVVKAYVEDGELPEISTDRPDLPVLSELKDAAAAKDYLDNLLTATAAAEEYLVYLEDVAQTVRVHLAKLEGAPSSAEEQQAEARTRDILADLEQTASAAKDYLNYLKGVAEAVRKFIADPNSPAPPQLETMGIPPSIPKGDTPAVESAPASGGSYLDALSSSPAPEPVPYQFKPESAAAASDGGSSTSYLENISSSSASVTPSGGGMQSYADSMASGAPAPVAEPPAPVAEAPAPKVEAPPPVAPPPPPPPPVAPVPPPPPPAPVVSSTSTSGKSYLETISSGKATSVPGGGGGPSSYLDSIKSGSAVKGSGAAQKGYLNSMEGQQVSKKEPADTAESEVEEGAGGAVFLGILVLALGALTQWYTDTPEQAGDLFRGAPTVAPVEKVAQPPPSPDAPVSPTTEESEEPDFDEWSF